MNIDTLATSPGLWHPTAPRRGAVVLFRRDVTAPRGGLRGLRLAISACHRYDLRLDGRTIARGPSRSDPRRWGVRVLTLPPLAAGAHVLAVVVCQDGDGAGESQLGGDGFLSIVGLGSAAALLDANGWRTWHDQSVSDCPEDGWGKARRYSPVGAHDRFDAARHPWGWALPGFAADGWLPPRHLRAGADVWGNLALGVQFVEESLPNMAETPLAWTRLAAGEAPAAWVSGDAALQVPPRTTARWVLDRGASGVHWPTVGFSGGRGAELRLTWCESPLLPDGGKGDRACVDGCDLPGHRDLLVPDGGEGRTWTPRWLRSGRYLVLDVTTGDQALRLDPVRLADSGFPFTRALRFTGDAGWTRLLAITDRTLRSCAHECIWDCPHYEQCQFPGDARVQSIAHYLLYGDDRLARKALRDLADSQRPDGLVMCRAPGLSPQRIDTFTLQFVLMLGEFLRWRGDAGVVRDLLPAARHAMQPFLDRLRPDGLVGGGLMAPFVDWSPGFTAGNAPEDADGGSAIIALLTAQACQALARLEVAAGWSELAPRWRRTAAGLVAAVSATCVRRGVLYDTPARRSRSVHAQVEAIHAGLFRGLAARHAIEGAVGADGVHQIGTRYYTWHLGRAWLAVGRPDRAVELVGGWTAQVARTPGLETWPESDGKPRSDCHGWGCYPVLAAAGIVLGVQPAVDGCAEITLAPHLGDLPAARGRVPTPHGPVTVEIVRRGDRLAVAWTSPVPVHCAGRRYAAGHGNVVMPAKA
jgi:alpha-L-rhamnosidase